MAADGSIIIDTSIDTDGMQVGTKEVENSLQRMAKTISGVGMTAKLSVKKQIDAFSRLNNQYAQQEQKVDSLKRKLIELSEQKIETSEYKKLEEELKLLEDKFDSVEAKQMEWINMGFPIDSAGIRELDEELDKIWADMDRINKKQEQMRKSGSAYMNLTDLKDYKVTQSKLLAEEQKLENMNSRLNTSYAGIKNNIQKYQKSLFKTDSATKKVTNSTSKLGKSVRNTQLSMGRMLATSVLFSTVFRIISAVTSGIGEGVNNLAQHSGTVNNSLSAMISSLERLKNAFATAFAPIINVVSPIISAFIDMLARAVTYVGMFFAALTGQSSFTKAVAVQKDYAAALQDTAGSAQDAADAMKDAEKAKNSYLSGLDEVNRYQSDKGSGSAGTSGPSAGGGGLSPSDMFETVPIENNIKNLADKLKKIFGEIFKPFKEAWEKEGEATIKAANYAFSSLGNLAKSVGKSMMSVWTNGTGTKMLSTMLQIGQNVLKTVGNIARQLEIAWNKNEVGTAIIQAIADAFQKVLDFVKRITKSTSEWAAELDFYPLLVSIKNLIESLSPIIEAIGDFLADLYENIVLPFLKWLIETALPKVINGISKIFDFLGKNKWIIDAVGTALVSAFAAKKIISAIMGIIGKIINLKNNIKFLISILTGSKGLSESIKTIGSAGKIASSGGLKSLLASIGSSGAGIGLIAILPVATKLIAGFVETLMGGNGKLSEMGAAIDDLSGRLQNMGLISSEQADEIYKIVDSCEDAGMSAEEMTNTVMEKFAEWGLSTQNINAVLQDNNYWTTKTKESVELLAQGAEQLGAGMSKTAGEIDLSSVSMKEAMGGMRDALWELSMTGGEFSGTYQGILMSMDDTLSSATTAQEALDMIAGQLEAVGIPADEFIDKLGVYFPQAAQTVKTSVDTNIVGAQQTVTSSMKTAGDAVDKESKDMKKAAEKNLPGVAGVVKTAFSDVDETTVTKWGSSSTEVKKNLDHMKQTAAKKLAEMTETVRSYSQSMYNIMTKKWESIAKRIEQIISEMNSKQVNPKLGSTVNIIQSRWQQAANRTEQMWNKISRTVANSISGMARKVRSEMNSVISTINYGISNINYSIARIESAMNFGPWEVPTATGSRIIGFHASFPRVPSVPYLASGAVIPPRSEFLAVLGDQKSGNNIEAPESLLRKIVREESGTSPGGGQYRFTAQLNRRTIFDEVIEEAKLRRDLNGRNPFLLT